MDNDKSQMNHKMSFWGGLITGIVAAGLLAGCIFLGKEAFVFFQASRTVANQTAGNAGEAQKEAVDQDTLNKLTLIEDTISKYYLEEVTGEQMEEGIYAGVLDSLGDPYSTYYSAEELKNIQQKTEGIYYGVGAYVGIDAATQLPLLSGIIEDTPAEEVGLRSGDLIYEVDGTSVQGMDLTEVVSMIKGEEGTKVHLTVIRDGETDYLQVDVERRKIESPTVSQKMLENDIGYIQIKEFDDVTVEQFIEALAVCKGSKMKGMILDLRGNPGGNLTAVCEIARQLLPEGLIVYTEDKYGERNEYTSDGSNQLETPLVVLVDSNSASASEILAGAIKDYGIGTLVGTTTFGKGIVQKIIPFTDGSAVKLTVSHYYTPKGNNIHKVGVAPDVEVAFDSDAYYNEDVDNQLNKAVEVINEKIGQ